MANEKKTNPVLLISVLAFFIGMGIGAWGWDKNESTIPERTKGGVAMMSAGGIMIAGGLLSMFLIGGKTKRD